MRLTPYDPQASPGDRLPEFLDDIMLHTNARLIAFITLLPLAGCSGGIDSGIAQMLILLGGLLTIPFVWRALKGSMEERREEARHQSTGSIYGGTATGEVTAKKDHGDTSRTEGPDAGRGGSSSDGGGNSGGGGD